MSSHDASDGSRGLSCIIEGNARGVVVQNMCLDGSVEEMLTNKAKVPVDS